MFNDLLSSDRHVSFGPLTAVHSEPHSNILLFDGRLPVIYGKNGTFELFFGILGTRNQVRFGYQAPQERKSFMIFFAQHESPALFLGG